MKTAAKSRASSEPTRADAAQRSPSAAGTRAPAGACGGRRTRPRAARRAASRGVGSRGRGALARASTSRPAKGSRGWTGGSATGLRRHPDEDVDAGLVDRAAQALAQVDLGLPAQEVAGAARCRAGGPSGRRWAAPRGRSPTREPVTSTTASASSSSVNSYGLPMLTGWCSPDSASAMIPRIEVVDVAERARLAAVAEDRDRAVRAAPGAGRSGSRGRRAAASAGRRC